MLTPTLDRRDLILVTGKGGTGKSTLVAALATIAARRRGRCLAVAFSASPCLAALLKDQENVETANIDPDRVVEQALTRLVVIPGVARLELRNRILRMFMRTSPAIREMIALDELHTLVLENAEQRVPVIADLPATGHAISFLDTPRSVREMLRIGPLAQVARRVEVLLRDAKRCELIAVALPEELPVNETIDLLRRARSIGVTGQTVVMNQVPTLPLSARERPLLDLLQHDDDETLSGFAGTVRELFERRDEARAQIDRLRQAVSQQIVELPRVAARDNLECMATMVRALT